MSADLNRAQQLASKALQDELLYQGLDSDGNPVSAFSKPPTFTGIAASLSATLGVGEATVYSTAGVGANDSAFKVVQWATQDLAFANPDPTNPRIDIIVVTPAVLLSDNAVRNILLNAVTRAFAPSLVPKTQSPTVTPVVVTGLASATPLPPAVPAGTFAILEVYVPAAAVDSVAFTAIPRLFRRAPYPFSGLKGFAPECGIIRGCQITYTGTFEAVASGDNVVVINGEVIEFSAISDLGNNDTLNNPFAAPAPGGNDLPYYLYVVGGRALPSSSITAPVSLVASLTAPNAKTGRPSAPIGAPRGVTDSAVYVGVGFVRKGTTNHQVCKMVGDDVWFASTVGADGGFETQSLAIAATPVSLPSAPAVSDEVEMQLQSIAGAAQLSLRSTAMAASNYYWAKVWAGAQTLDGTVRIPISASAGGPHFGRSLTGATLDVYVVAYKLNVRRLG